MKVNNGETWRNVYDYENNIVLTKYSVSNYGKVRNELTGKIIKPRIFDNRFHTVILHNNERYSSFLVGRLVAHSFVNNDDLIKNNSILYLDDNTLNNNFNNLVWANPSIDSSFYKKIIK
jgi:hypothetical protein